MIVYQLHPDGRAVPLHAVDGDELAAMLAPVECRYCRTVYDMPGLVAGGRS